MGERGGEPRGARRVHQHPGALQVARAVQAGGEDEMPLEQRIGGAEFGEDLVFGHRPFPARLGRPPDRRGARAAARRSKRRLRRRDRLPIRPAKPPLGAESVPLRRRRSPRGLDEDSRKLIVARRRARAGAGRRARAGGSRARPPPQRRRPAPATRSAPLAGGAGTPDRRPSRRPTRPSNAGRAGTMAAAPPPTPGIGQPDGATDLQPQVTPIGQEALVVPRLHPGADDHGHLRVRAAACCCS